MRLPIRLSEFLKVVQHGEYSMLIIPIIVTKEIDWLCSQGEVCKLLGKDVLSRSEYLF